MDVAQGKRGSGGGMCRAGGGMSHGAVAKSSKAPIKRGTSRAKADAEAGLRRAGWRKRVGFRGNPTTRAAKSRADARK